MTVNLERQRIQDLIDQHTETRSEQVRPLGEEGGGESEDPLSSSPELEEEEEEIAEGANDDRRSVNSRFVEVPGAEAEVPRPS